MISRNRLLEWLDSGVQTISSRLSIFGLLLLLCLSLCTPTSGFFPLSYFSRIISLFGVKSSTNVPSSPAISLQALEFKEFQGIPGFSLWTSQNHCRSSSWKRWAEWWNADQDGLDFLSLLRTTKVGLVSPKLHRPRFEVSPYKNIEWCS